MLRSFITEKGLSSITTKDTITGSSNNIVTWAANTRGRHAAQQ